MNRNYIVISKEIANKLIGNNKNRDAYIYAYTDCVPISKPE